MAPLGAPTHVLATADDPAHAAHRKQIVPQLAAKRIHSIERFARDTADDIWATNLNAGRIEWMSAMANKLPMMVVARLIGVPSDDVERLDRWGSAGTQLLEGLLSEEELNAAGMTALEMMAYLDENFTLAAADPQDNLLGDLATACASNELDRLTAQVIMGTLFSAGGESTSSLLGSAAHILTKNSSERLPSCSGRSSRRLCGTSPLPGTLSTRHAPHHFGGGRYSRGLESAAALGFGQS